MRYSYEYKRKCVELYRQGLWMETPDGIKNKNNFRNMIRRWTYMVDANGFEVLKSNRPYQVWTAQEKFQLVSRVSAGETNLSVAIEAGIKDTQLSEWVRKYKIYGYNGLISQKEGLQPQRSDMKKKNINNPRKLDETEYEELLRLREENAYIKAENEVIKKQIALRHEKWAAQLKAKKQQSSKNSEKKDIN